MKPLMIPIPFAMGPYGNHDSKIYKRILEVSGADSNAAAHNSSNVLQKILEVTPEISFEIFPNTQPEVGEYLDSVISMQQSVLEAMNVYWQPGRTLLVVGGDHSISIGTGAGLAQQLDMSQVGLIWVDAHGDCNTPETSKSKSITGYPVAIVTGHGPQQLLERFRGNVIHRVAHIGVRDFDDGEDLIARIIGSDLYSSLDVERLGVYAIINNILDSMSQCSTIWLSVDIDVLDPIYFETGETDVPVPMGLTPREVMIILEACVQSGKQLVVELTQLNDIGKQTPLVVWSSRFLECAAGAGGFRYGSERVQ